MEALAPIGGRRSAYKMDTMNPVKISKKEETTLKRCYKFPLHLLILFILLIIIAGIFSYVVAVWGKAEIVSVFIPLEEPCPGVKQYVEGIFEDILSAFAQPAFLFFSISLGVTIGAFINHIRLSKLLKKIDVIKMVQTESSDEND